MPASTKPTAHQIHEATPGVKLDQAVYWLLTLRLAGGTRKARNAPQPDHSIRHQATSDGAELQESSRAAVESILLGLLAMALFHPASGIMLSARRRMRAALISQGRAGDAVSQRPGASATPMREERFTPCGAEAPETPHESRAEQPLFESIPDTRSGKLQRYLGNLDAASRSNLERHLNNPGVSSTAICDSLLRHGFIIGRTTVKDYRRHSAARIQSDAGTGTNRPADELAAVMRSRESGGCEHRGSPVHF